MENEIEKLAIEALPDVFLNGRIIFPNDTAQNRRMWAKGYKAALSKGNGEVSWDDVNEKWESADMSWAKFRFWLRENYIIIPKTTT